MIDLTQLTVSDRLGGGSQGSVFLASDPRGVRYTVKLVVLGENADRERIFERAARFREDVLHRSMVPILSYGMVSAAPQQLAQQLGKLSRDALVVVMPYIAGTSLADLMAASPLTLQETVVVLLGVTQALEKFPEELIHGDLRPPNVFLRPSGEVMLMDPNVLNRPPDGDDMLALGGMTLVLVNAALPSDDAEAIALLRTFATDIAGHGMPHGVKLEAHEARQRLQLIAESLGAPREHPETVLVKRLKAYEARPAARVDSHAAGASSERWNDFGYWWAERRLTLRLFQFLGVALLLAAIAAAYTRIRTRPVAASVAESPPPAEQSEVGGGLYDHSGKVHYPGTVHVLGPGELAASTDGLFEADIRYSIPRLALMSGRRELLWEIRRPDAGALLLLDVKPGPYLVEMDREIDAGLEHDVRPVVIDRHNPFRLTATPDIEASPHKPKAP